MSPDNELIAAQVARRVHTLASQRAEETGAYEPLPRDWEDGLAACCDGLDDATLYLVIAALPQAAERLRRKLQS